MTATGEDALVEIEIANAAYLSGYTGKAVDLPVNAGAVERLFDRLERERSTGRGGGMRKAAWREMRKLTRKR